MCEKRPVVSVIIPTDHRASLVGRAVRSVLREASQDSEIITVDDLSPDASDGVVPCHGDEPVRSVAHRENRGGAVAREHWTDSCQVITGALGDVPGYAG